jgi:glucose-1-phosphate thymidylyltransferase
MKGVLLAGGTGSRLMPLTNPTNKSLLPMGRQTIVEHVLDTLLSSGAIEDVMVISGPEHFGQLAQLLGSGDEHDCRLTYRVQDKANGIAAALGMCEDFVGHDKFVVILGDNIFEDNKAIASKIVEFEHSDDEYGLFVHEVPDPQRFGVVAYGPSGEILDIVEKPKDPPSRDAVLGLYMYTPAVFRVIRKLQPSARGEYEISDVNSFMVKHRDGRAHRVECGWVDAGTHESYERATEMMRRKLLNEDVALVKAVTKEFK